MVFDDQRPGWDSTSRDLTKYKLTDEQVEVSAVPGAPPSLTRRLARPKGRFQIISADSTLTARPNRPRTQARRKQFVSKNLAAAKGTPRA